MDLDVRLPMGVMFVLLGGVLSIYGAISDRAIYKSSLNININLWWGLVIFGFGVILLLLAWWARVSPRPEPPKPTPPERETGRPQ
ncbi:MAG TPA: hypothetical protein VLJ39_21825 [Tepidisphaeraceae bacterium]|jgi:membrane protein implicated in regulation of membrane protease activity|nr:hypothetical protein [Tepidisphaeraceae bacterium]